MLRSHGIRRLVTASAMHRCRAGRQQQQAIPASIAAVFDNHTKNEGFCHLHVRTASSLSEPGSLLERFSNTAVSDNNSSSIISSSSSSSSSDNSDRDAPLRNDVRTMGSLLGSIIKEHHGSDTFDKIETLRGLAKQWREDKYSSNTEETGTASFQKLVGDVSKLSNEDVRIMARAFTHFLAIANAAEAHHRCRLLDLDGSSDGGALPNKTDSCGGALQNLLDQGHDANTIYEQLISQQVELVLTAHPTEVNRRIILEKQRRVQKLLTKADSLRASNNYNSFAQSELDRALQREIAGLWQSDEVSREKPTPQMEAERGTLIVETVLWEALPSYLRKLNYTIQNTLDGKKSLPLTAAPIIFSSWMGGDRDGNPNVKPETTKEVCYKKRAQAAGLFKRDLQRLERELSIVECSPKIRSIVGDSAQEPYRAMLRPMIQKLDNTQKWAEAQLLSLDQQEEKSENNNNDIYLSKDTLMKELLDIHQSLCDTDNEVTADGFLTDIIRNVSAFGLTLVKLDVRQESTRHEEALDAITRYLGAGSYSQWDEETKLNWLSQQLASPRPLLRPGVWKDHPEIFSSPTVIDTLETFSMIANLPEESLGAYVISQATHASDVLAVLLLQRDAGVKKPLRVVPLFETLDDLNGAEHTMKQLFSLPGYMGSINGKQEVMIGYSDSAKDAGRLAASWAQYETQEALAKLARDFNVDLTFFHGKGGTVGRGGNPQTYLAILAHAPNTINGKFRVTEQGEMINQNFGYLDRAERTMDIYTAAVLAEKLTHRPDPSNEWREMMQKLSDVSCDAYRNIVRQDERFVPYFRTATPEVELAGMNIGSRPAKRKPTGGVESLRAIPWIFAWIQMRLNLPSWLGVGDGIHALLNNEEDAEKLRTMYKEWGSFRATVDLVEMVLAKAEPTISKNYETQLVSDASAIEFGQELRNKCRSTSEAILDLTEHEKLSENNRMLTRLMQVRNPYVDVINVLQAETLKRIRANEEEVDPVLQDALKTTITGIANGMGNSG